MRDATRVKLRLLRRYTTWSHYLPRDITALGNVQRQFTKKIRGLENTSHEQRLADLHTTSLASRRVYADLLTTFKYMHGLVDSLPTASDYKIRYSSTKGDGTRLFQHHAVSASQGTYFHSRLHLLATVCR